MPKRVATPLLIETDRTSALATWQAAGLALAVIATSAFSGLGALLGAAAIIPVIYALARLRRGAPGAATTASLIGSTLGPLAGGASALIQACAYVVLAAKVAMLAGLQLLAVTAHPSDGGAGALAWLPAYVVGAAVVGAAAAYFASTRVVAGVVAVAAGAGLLIYVYLALAVVARVASGDPPVVIGSAATATPLSGQVVVGFGLAMVGAEAITARSRLIAAPGRAMSLAVGTVSLVAVMVWLADHQGAAGPWRWTARNFTDVVLEFYGTAGQQWLRVAGIAVSWACLVAMTWATMAVAENLPVCAGRGASPPLGLIAAGLAAGLAVLGSASWAGARWMAAVLPGIGLLLLLVVYVAVAQANARIPGDSVVAWWVRLLVPALAVAVVVTMLAGDDRGASPLVQVVVAGVIVAGAAAAALALARVEAAVKP